MYFHFRILVLSMLTNFLFKSVQGYKSLGPQQPQQGCSDSLGNNVTGIRPDLFFDDFCHKFWLCRIRDRDAEPEELPIEPVLFNCSYVDPTKPFFNAKLCQCVATDDHCAENQWNSNACTRLHDPTEPVESCRGYGEGKEYYENLFVNFDFPSKFWSCQPNDFNTTVAQSFDCPNNTVYNAKSCSCAHPDDPSVSHDPYNIHPFHRYDCATPYTGYSEENCTDSNGNYYEGLFLNHNPNEYWNCVPNGHSPPKSEPHLNSCSESTFFNIHTCNCTEYFPPDNYDPIYRYNCAKLLEDSDDEPSCRDQDGHYHIGDIPNKKDCTKFWSCALTGNPAKPSAPLEKFCYPSTMFNVHSTFCGCDHPGNFKCQDNLIPEDQFLCATTIVS